MKVLPRDEALKAVKIAPTPVLIPEWGQDTGMFVKVMNALERDAFEAFWAKPTAGISKRAFFVRLVACDENGSAIFTDEDIAELSANDFRPLNRIMEVGVEINALGREQQDALKKSSEITDTGAGPSASVWRWDIHIPIFCRWIRARSASGRRLGSSIRSGKCARIYGRRWSPAKR